MDKQKNIYHSINPIEAALENEIARLSEEGFTVPAKSLVAALALVKKAEADEYNQWRIEQGAEVRGLN